MASRVWVVVQLRDGQVSRISWEAVAAAQRLAAVSGAGGGKAEAVVLGSGSAVAAAAADLAKADLAAVHTADHEALRAYTPGGWIGALAPALKEAQPAWVVFPHTYQSVDFVPRLAQTIGAGLLPEVTGFAESGGGLDSLEWTRPILGGKMQAKVRVKGEGTVLVSVQSGAFPADGVVTGGAAPVHPLSSGSADLAGLKPDREILGYEEVAGDQIDLTKADIILAVGRGIGGADKMGPVEELAKALGAEIGASRPVIDNGWLPRDRQIGSSGQTVAPKLYIAAGISGAIQHLVGMKGSTVVVAINKDPGAPIFTVAHYGIVGDLHEILPALTEAVRAAKG
ncbi:MAG TPA: electron transfer flavoprotein subunit alpha/FixB family protein [Thermoanaerobaculia bacterium]|jgi:electron transfer flavoprotein alpha subunit|nr:electron transfer flavoprotein subunit alpha/FixB family protein [Thermoanaerobaculia bacterium]